MRAHSLPQTNRTSTASVLTFPPTQMQKLLLPREHGSWGLWALPLISGAMVGWISGKGQTPASLVLFWFCLAAACAFLVYQPLEVLLDLSPLKARSKTERRLAWSWVFAATAVGMLSMVELVRLGRGRVLLFATLGLACFGVRWLFGKTRALREGKQIVGALGLTSAAAGAYYVTTGRIDATALLLWGASWLFASGQIEFVQLCISTASAKSRLEKFAAGRKVFYLHLLLVVASIAAAEAGLVSILMGIAFIPAMLRLIAWGAARPHKINFHVLGFAELSQSFLFSGLLVAAFVIRG
ncbi:MAG: YwiC-like family protein [Acidobacteriia bacterium]|nr:YwiC-like family protein [Terriglobia bacterium]